MSSFGSGTNDVVDELYNSCSVGEARSQNHRSQNLEWRVINVGCEPMRPELWLCFWKKHRKQINLQSLTWLDVSDVQQLSTLDTSIPKDTKPRS